MPERRARMLNVEDAPVVSVPVMAGEGWMQEPAVATATVSVVPVIEFNVPVAPPAPRFLSEDEEPEEAMPTTSRVAVQRTAVSEEAQVEPEPELVGAPARPKFAELEEEPVYTPLPRDYASDLGNGVHQTEAVEERRPQPVGVLFNEPGADTERDLDVPAFMRRLQF
jgi:cell division protein FtsZ